MTSEPQAIYFPERAPIVHEIKFPATFNTGNPPDYEILPGSVLNVEVKAFNAGGISPTFSASVTPSSSSTYSLSEEETVQAQQLLYYTYKNRKEVYCGQIAESNREALRTQLVEAGYDLDDINATYGD